MRLSPDPTVPRHVAALQRGGWAACPSLSSRGSHFSFRFAGNLGTQLRDVPLTPPGVPGCTSWWTWPLVSRPAWTRDLPQPQAAWTLLGHPHMVLSVTVLGPAQGLGVLGRCPTHSPAQPLPHVAFAVIPRAAWHLGLPVWTGQGSVLFFCFCTEDRTPALSHIPALI